MRRWIAVAALIIVIAVGWRVLASTSRRSQTPAPAPAEVVVPVEVAPVRTQTLVTTVSAGGTVEAVEEVVVTTKLAGRVAAVPVKEGDAVYAGQVLVRLEADEMLAQVQQAEANVRAAQARLRMLEQGARSQERAQVEAAVEQARAGYESAKAGLARMQSLYETGAVSKAQLDAAQLQHDVAKAQYESALQQRSVVQTGPRPEEMEMARAQVAQAQAALQYVRLQAANTTISSPISGTVTRRSVDPGELVSTMPGQANLVTVAQLDQIYLALDVSETDLGKIRVGQQVTIHADSYPDRTFQGTVRELAQAADFRTRTFKVKVLVVNRDHALRPGMFARGEITVARLDGVMVIPRDAIVRTNGEATVFVVEGGKAHLRTVQLGITGGPIVEIRRGLQPGESVVVAGQSDLSDGQGVTVR